MAGGNFVGLDIGSQQMKVVETKKDGSGVAVTALGVAPTPQEAFENSVLVDSQLLGKAVKDLLKQAGVTARECVSSVSGQSAVVVRVIDVPQMKPTELAETMKWEVERHVPFAASEVIMDYQLIERPEGYAEGQNMDVLLAVAQQDMIDRHVEMLFAAGLKPKAIDVEPLAAGRSLLEMDQTSAQMPGHTIAIVNIGASNTDIGIFRDKLPAFPRTLPLAGDNLTRAIADGLQVDMATAEQYKRELGEVIFGQAQPAMPDFGGGGGGFGQATGFMDFTTPAPEPEPPPTSSPSGRMPFDFSTPSETAPPAPVEPAATPFDMSAPAPTPSPFEMGGEPAPAPTSPFATGGGAAQPAPGSSPFDFIEEVPQPPTTTPDPGFMPPDFGTPPPSNNLPVPTNGGYNDPQREMLKTQVFNCMAPVLAELVQELRRSLDYYRGKASDAEIHEIWLTGGTAKLRNLAPFLEAELGIASRVADPMHNVRVVAKNFSAEYLEENGTLFPVSIGLGAYKMGSAGDGGRKKKK